MKRPACERLWQAEAAEDGRLSEADRASFTRHVASCSECRREVEILSALRDATGRLPVLTSTPLERRRLRNEILRRADEIAVRSPQPPTFGRLTQMSVVALLAVVTAAAALWLGRSAFTLRSQAATIAAAPSVPVQASVPTFRINASPDSEWATKERGPALRLSITSGRVELEVDPLRPGQSFLVDLPDGELEVRGTRFIVEANGAHTLGVRVLNGRVALRLDHRAPLALGAGQQYSAEPAPAAPSKVEAPPAAAPIAPVTTSPDPKAPAHVSPPAAAGQETSEFAVAVAAFSSGDFGRAEQLFIEFETRHPGDTRVEDAVFLRAVARARRGDSSGAQAAALEYLRRYPNGLRRQDAERLVR